MSALLFEKTGTVVTLTINRAESAIHWARRATVSCSPRPAAASTPTVMSDARS
jgi:hypothetical protein